jgi:hypothetical protein
LDLLNINGINLELGILLINNLLRPLLIFIEEVLGWLRLSHYQLPPLLVDLLVEFVVFELELAILVLLLLINVLHLVL